MQVSVENTGTLGRRVTIAVPAEQFEAEIQQRLKRLSKNAKLPGFRPGKVPMKVLESKYGKQVLGEAAGELIERSLYEALQQHRLSPAASPDIEAKTMERGKDLEYAANFEVMPEVKRTELGGVEVKRPQSEVLDTDVDATIEKMRRQRTTWTAVDRACKKDDQLVLDFVGTIDGEPFQGGKGENYTVILGKGGLLPDFEQGLLGARAGEEKVLSVKFPDDYHGKDVAGKTAQFEVQVKEVREASLPEVDEEFAKSFGVEDGDVWKLKNEVKENLNRELEQRISRLLRERMLDALLEVNDIEVPKKLVDQEIDRTIESNKAALAQQGISVDDVEPDRSRFEADARRRVLLGVILRKIVEERQLKPDEAVVRARIERTAEGYEDPQAFVQWYYSDNKRLLEVQSMVLEEQVVEELLKTADVTDEKIPFSTLVGE